MQNIVQCAESCAERDVAMFQHSTRP